MLKLSTSLVRKFSIQQPNCCISAIPLSRLNSKYSNIHFQDHRFVVKRNYSMKGKKYVYAHKFEGMPKVTDLQLVEEEIPAVKNGGIYIT